MGGAAGLAGCLFGAQLLYDKAAAKSGRPTRGDASSALEQASARVPTRHIETCATTLLNIFDQLLSHRDLISAATHNQRAWRVVSLHQAVLRGVADLRRGFLEIVRIAGVVQEKH